MGSVTNRCIKGGGDKTFEPVLQMFWTLRGAITAAIGTLTAVGIAYSIYSARYREKKKLGYKEGNIKQNSSTPTARIKRDQPTSPSKKDSDQKGWKSQVQRKLNESKKIKNKAARLQQLDKILERALQKKYGQQKSVGEILTEKGVSFFSAGLLKSVWDAHNHRNKLVHDLDARIPERDLSDSIRTLERAIQTLLEQK